MSLRSRNDAHLLAMQTLMQFGRCDKALCAGAADSSLRVSVGSHIFGIAKLACGRYKMRS